MGKKEKEHRKKVAARNRRLKEDSNRLRNQMKKFLDEKIKAAEAKEAESQESNEQVSSVQDQLLKQQVPQDNVPQTLDESL